MYVHDSLQIIEFSSTNFKVSTLIRYAIATEREREMAYPGEYRREQYLGEDGYVEGGEYNGRGYATEAGYGAPYGSEGYGARPYGGEQYEHHKHGHHHQPEVVYVQPEESDLGTGLSGGLRGEGYGGGYSGGYSEGYGAGYGRNQPGYAAAAAYGAGGYENAQVERLEEELKVERRRAHEAEAAAAAATAYAAHERHERKEEEEEELERFEPIGERRHKHHFFD